MIAVPVMHVRAGRWTRDFAAGFLLQPVVDMMLFGAFFGAAIVYRHRPEIHKRLIVATTVVLTFPAAARMNFALPALFLVWMSPMAAAMAFDVWSRGRPHVVNVICTTVLAIAFVRLLFLESAGWLVIGRAILAPFL